MFRDTWRTWAALAVVAVAAALDWWWVWGVWMAYYAWVGVRRGETFLVERVPRAAWPVLFWLVIAVWAGFGVWMVVADLSLRIPWWIW